MRLALAIETVVTVKFQLEQQLLEEEAHLAHLSAALAQIEQALAGADEEITGALCSPSTCSKAPAGEMVNVIFLRMDWQGCFQRGATSVSRPFSLRCHVGLESTLIAPCSPFDTSLSGCYRL